MKIEKL